MKSRKYSIPLAALVVTALVAGCQAVVSQSGVPAAASGLPAESAASPNPSALPQSMKGWDLYSWQEGGQWRYSLLPGTNRAKTWAEISAPAGADAMTSQTDTTVVRDWFSRLGRGSEVMWWGPGAVNVESAAAPRLEHPPLSVQTQFQAWAADAGVTLTMDAR